MTEPSDTGDDVSNDASARDDNDDNSFDASSNEDPEEAAADDSHLRVKRTGRLGPENKRHLRDATIYRKSLFITNPINPADRALKPEQLIMKGMNLNRWEQVKKDLAILGGRRRSAPPSLVPELVQDLVAGKRLREVHGKVYAQKEMWDLRFAKGKVTSSIYEYQWTVLKTEYDKNVAQAVLNQVSLLHLIVRMSTRAILFTIVCHYLIVGTSARTHSSHSSSIISSSERPLMLTHYTLALFHLLVRTFASSITRQLSAYHIGLQ